MPQHFKVVVISGHDPRGGELATSVASLLADNRSGVAPWYTAAADKPRCRAQLYSALAARGIEAVGTVLPELLDPREIHLWLALDPRGEGCATRAITARGREPEGFYRSVFPNPIVRFGPRDVKPLRSVHFESWLTSLAEQVLPWREKFWDAFCASS